MEDNDKVVLSDQPVGKEYQIPELVDLNGIGGAMGVVPCTPGSGADFCGTGGSGAVIDF